MTLQTAVNCFDKPNKSMKVALNFSLENSIIEMCNEVIESQTLLLPEFRPFFRYDDLYMCCPKLHNKIANYSPYFIVKKHYFKREIPESYI